MRKITLLVALIFTLCFSACSEPPTNSESSQTPASQATSTTEEESVVATPDEQPTSDNIIEPSQLISKEDVERILGGTIDEIKTDGSPTGGKNCEFDGEWIFCNVAILQKATIPPATAAAGFSPESYFQTIIGEREPEGEPFQEFEDEVYGGFGMNVLHNGYCINLTMMKYEEGNIKSLIIPEMYAEALKIIIGNLDELAK